MERYDCSRGLTPYERLAVAIVRQAVLDWQYLAEEQQNYRKGGIGWERTRCDKYLLEKWFLGDWCNLLTYGNGEVLLDMLKKGVEF